MPKISYGSRSGSEAQNSCGRRKIIGLDKARMKSLAGGAELSSGERLTKRDLIRPEQAYLYKTCVKQSTLETTSAWEFLSLNRKGFGAFVRDGPSENSQGIMVNKGMTVQFYY